MAEQRDRRAAIPEQMMCRRRWVSSSGTLMIRRTDVRRSYGNLYLWDKERLVGVGDVEMQLLESCCSR